eukprot:SAG31_NODE_118_length_24006_cov_8.219266_10_plen_548_part_00
MGSHDQRRVGPQRATDASVVVAVALPLRQLLLLLATSVSGGSDLEMRGDRATTSTAVPRPQQCTARVWTAVAESMPSGHNKPKACPGCAGQNVSCSDCGNIVPLYHLALSRGSEAVAAALSFQRGLPPTSPAAIMPMYSPEGTGRAANRPGWSNDPGGDFDGLISEFGVTGPAGHNIMPAVDVLYCGNFSGIWIDGQVAAVAKLWGNFLRELKVAEGRLDEVVLDTERSLSLEFIRARPNSTDAGPDCGRLRLRSIQADPRFATVRKQLAQQGFQWLSPATDPDSLWRAVGPSSAAAYSNSTQRANGDIWDQLMRQRAAAAFNTAIAKPAWSEFGQNITISDYSYQLCKEGEGHPNAYGNRGCGMPGTIAGVDGVQGALVGSTAAPVCYQTFHLYAAHYFLGGPRPGLPRGLNTSYGVRTYPRTPFNVFRFDSFAARQSAAVRATPFKTWVGYSRMGAGPYWPASYGVTNGSGYYAETWFHHALAGAAGFLYYNPLSYQLDGTDNQLFSDVLKELDALVGCEERHWIRDSPVSCHELRAAFCHSQYI